MTRPKPARRIKAVKAENVFNAWAVTTKGGKGFIAANIEKKYLEDDWRALLGAGCIAIYPCLITIPNRPKRK